jgi:predicted transcriptional regulator
MPRSQQVSDQTQKTQSSLRVPTVTLDAFDLVAKALERDRTWVMLRAFRLYLDGEGADILRDANGIAALDRGEGVDFDGVMEEADAIIAQAKMRHPRNAS